jgi:hypothetical protein
VAFSLLRNSEGNMLLWFWPRSLEDFEVLVRGDHTVRHCGGSGKLKIKKNNYRYLQNNFLVAILKATDKKP